MPKYQITALDGRVVTVEGDAPPTEADAEEIFGQLGEAPKAENKPIKMPASAKKLIATAATFMSGGKVPAAVTEKLLFSPAKVNLPVVGEVDVISEGARFAAPMAGAVLGGPVGGAVGGVGGEALAQTREIFAGDRDKVSAGRLLGMGALSAFVPKPLQAGVSLAKGAAIRGGQALAMGEGALLAEKGIDERRLPTLEEAITAGAVSFGAGSVLGGLEKGVPKLWNAIKGKPPKEAKAIVESSNLDETAKKQLSHEIDELLNVGAPAKSAEESAQVLSANMPAKSASSSARAFEGQKTPWDIDVEAEAGKRGVTKSIEETGEPLSAEESAQVFGEKAPAKSAKESAAVFAEEKQPDVIESTAKSAFSTSEFNQRVLAQADVLKKLGIPFNKQSREAARALASAESPEEYNLLMKGIKKQLIPEVEEGVAKAPPLKSFTELPENIGVPAKRVGDNLFSGEAGRISPKLMAPLAGSAVGGAGGAAYGYQTGEGMPEDRRLLRAGIYGAGGALAGLAAGGKLGQVAERGTLFRTPAKAKADLLKQIKSENVGIEGMPEWYRNWRTKPIIQTIRDYNRSAITLVKDASDELAQKLEGELPPEANAYSKASRLPGVTEHARAKGEEAFKTYSENVTNIAKGLEMDPAQFRERLQEYQRAKYAPKVNAMLRAKATEAEPYKGSGMTDEQAAGIIAKAKADGIDDVLEGLSSSYGDLVDMTRRALRDGGLISEQLYNKWKKELPDYVPLQRIMEDDIADDAVEMIGSGLGGGPGRSVLATGIKKIKGSERAVKDLDQSQLENWYDAIKRAETNKYGQSVLEMVNLAKGKGGMLEGVRVIEPKYGEQFRPNSMLSVYKDGRKYWIEFDDPKLAMAFSATNAERLPWYMAIPARANQFMAGVFTRFNPDFFAISNPVRDAIEIAHKGASQGDIRGIGSYLNPKKIGENAVAVWDWSHGGTSEGAKLFERLSKAGGLTGGYAGTSKNAAKAMINRFRTDEKNFIIQKKDDFVAFVDMLNRISEGSNRLAAFKRAIESGATDEEAAMYARKASIDFNMKGSKTGALAAWKAFVNPTLQAPVNAAKNYVRNPALMASTATTLLAFAGMQDAINSQTDPEWRKKLGWENNNGIPFIFGKKKDGDLRVVTIPLPQSLRPTKAFIDASISLAQPNADENAAADAAGRIIASFADNVVPFNVDVSSPKAFARSAAPTFLTPIIEAGVNQNYQGRDITPTYYSKEAAERVKTFPSFRQSEVGKMAMAFSDELAKVGMDVNPQRLLYIARQYSGGPGKLLLGTGMGDWGDVAKAIQAGEAPPMASLPIVRSVIKEVPGEVTESKTQAYRAAAEMKSEEETAKIEKSQRIFDAVNVFNKAKEKGDEEKMESGRNEIRAILAEHPEWDKDVLRTINNASKGYNQTDNMIDSLGKKDGTRAKYIVGQLNRLPDNEAKRAYLMDLAGKELLDDTVMSQVAKLLSETQ